MRGLRPVRLELEGFSTFRDRVELDFDGIDLVAFTGPTGAGKSTLIDAMTFALYGSVARYDNNRVAPVIHQLSTEARVRLDFASGGRNYTVVRVVRRTRGRGRPRKEARLERVEATVSTVRPARWETRSRNCWVSTSPSSPARSSCHRASSPPSSATAGDRQKLLQKLLGCGVYARMGQEARLRLARPRRSSSCWPSSWREPTR